MDWRGGVSIKAAGGVEDPSCFSCFTTKTGCGTRECSTTLLEGLIATDPIFLPKEVLQQCWLHRNGVDVEQVLVQWQGLDPEESSWEDVVVMKGQFPEFSLEVKAIAP